MTPSIHLVELTVSGWKGIKNTASIRFGEHSWLIHGANEAGKSSLFSALRFALFENSAKGGAFSDGWVNNDSTQAEVEVALKIGGVPYTIRKIRDHKKKGSTRLFRGVGDGRRALDVKDKDADQKIVDLLGASARKGRDAEMPSNWGIMAWLLAPQSIDTVHDARKHGTQALGLGRAISPEFQLVREQVSAFDNANFGKSSAPLKASELYQSQEEVTRVEDELTTLGARRDAFDEALQVIARLEQTQPRLLAALKKSELSYEARRDSDVNFATDEAHLKTLDKVAQLKARDVKAATAAVAALEKLDTEVVTATRAVRKHSQTTTKLEDRAAQSRESLQAVVTSLDELGSRRDRNHVAIEQNRSWLAAWARAERLTLLDEALSSIATLDAQLATLEAAGALLSEAEIDERVQLASDLEQADSLLANLAAERGVTVTMTGALDATWLRDGVPAELGDGLNFASDLEIQAERFTVSVRFDRAADEVDWPERRRSLAAQVTALGCVDGGCADVAALRREMKAERLRTRRYAEAQRERTVLGNKDQLAEEAESLRTEIQQNTVDGEMSEVPAGTPNATTLSAEVTALTNENLELVKELKKLQTQRTSLEKKRLTQGRELEAARAEHKSATDQLAAVGNRRDEELAGGGLLNVRVEALSTLETALESAIQELADAKNQLESNKGAHSDELKRLQRVKAQAAKNLRDCETDIGVAQRKAEELGGENLQARRITLSGELHAARQALTKVKRRAEAKRRLSARLRTFMVDATDVETGPIRRRVEEWLRVITQGHWQSITMDSQLEVTRLEGNAPTIKGETMGSAGLRQVIHALTRLAVAVKIHEDGREVDPNYPAVSIVMDESQSNVDTERVQRLMHVFNEQIEAGRVQVMALSHRQDEFLNLHARSYDISRRQAYDLDDV